MMEYQNLLDEIKSIEHIVAYGSETFWWGLFLNDMAEQYPDIDPHEPGENDIISDEFAEWWLDLYHTESDLYDYELTDDERTELENYGDAEDYIKIAKNIMERHNMEEES